MMFKQCRLILTVGLLLLLGTNLLTYYLISTDKSDNNETNEYEKIDELGYYRLKKSDTFSDVLICYRINDTSFQQQPPVKSLDLHPVKVEIINNKLVFTDISADMSRRGYHYYSYYNSRFEDLEGDTLWINASVKKGAVDSILHILPINLIAVYQQLESTRWTKKLFPKISKDSIEP